MRRHVALFICLVCGSADAYEPVPYELAFDKAELGVARTSEMSPDGKSIAYEVRRAPAEHSDGAASMNVFRQSGIPPFAVGNRIFISDVQTKKVTQVCPDAGNAWRPSWSPDSRYLAFYSDKSGVPTLWTHEAGTGNCRQVSSARINTDLYVGDAAQWSPDGRTVYLVLTADTDPLQESASKQTGEASGAAKIETYYSGTETDAAEKSPTRVEGTRGAEQAYVGAVDIASGAIRTLVPSATQPAPHYIRLSASGKWLSYLSVSHQPDATRLKDVVSLAVVPTSGGEVRVVSDGLELPMVLMGSTLVYSWHPAGDRLVFTKDQRLWLVELGAEGPATPRQLAAELGELAFDVLWFTRDGKSVIAGTDPDPAAGADLATGHARAFAVIALDGGPPKRLSFDTGRWTFEDILKADARTVWQPDAESITLRLRERSTGGCAIVRINIRSGKSNVLWQGLAEMGGRQGTWTSGGDQSFIIGTYEDYATPRDVYRFSADFSRKERLTTVEPRLHGIRMGTIEVFETLVPLYDGRLEKTVTSVLLPPGAKRGDRLPAIVMFYPDFNLTGYSGRQFGGGVGGFVEPPLLFTSRGYAVLLTHVKVAPEGQPGNPIKDMVDSLLPQVYHAAQLGYVDIGRLALRGNSYGGYGTIAVVSQTNLFRAAVPSSGFYDLGAHYGELHAGISNNVAYFENGQGRMGEPPWTNISRYIDNSPYYRADKIFTPILMIQGGDDSAAETGKLFTALRRLNKPAQLAIYPGQGHAVPLWSRAYAIDASKRIMRFYRKHLGGNAGLD